MMQGYLVNYIYFTRKLLIIMAKKKSAIKPFTFTITPSSSGVTYQAGEVSLENHVVDTSKVKLLDVSGPLIANVDYAMTAVKDLVTDDIFLVVGCQIRRLDLWRRVANRMADEHLYEMNEDVEVPSMDDVPDSVSVDTPALGDISLSLSETERKKIFAEMMNRFKSDYPDYDETQTSSVERVKATLPSFFDAVEKKFAPKPKKKKK
jgi:hypothetical protein